MNRAVRDHIYNGDFDALDALIASEDISLDVFEYDAFNRSLFEVLIEYLPLSKVGLDTACQYLETFLPRVENLNDALQNKTLLTLACEAGWPLELVKVLVDNGCDVTYIDTNGKTLMHRLVQGVNPRVSESQVLPLMQLCADHGVDVMAKDNAEDTPLHLAVRDGRAQLVAWLLEQGADATEKNNQDKTPITLALDYGLPHISELLATYGATIDEDSLAQECYTFIERIYSASPSESELAQLKQFAGVNVWLPIQDAYGRETSIARVFVTKSSAWFEAFLELFSLGVNDSDNEGNTLLHMACGQDLNFDQQKAKELYRMVKKLLALGADPTKTNTQDKTPADLALTDNLKEKVLALLLKAGATVQ